MPLDFAAAICESEVLFVSADARAGVVLAGAAGAFEAGAAGLIAGGLRSGRAGVVDAVPEESESGLRLRRDFLGAGSLLVVAGFELAAGASVAAAGSDSAFFLRCFLGVAALESALAVDASLAVSACFFFRDFFVPESACDVVAVVEPDAAVSVSDFFLRRLFFFVPVSLSAGSAGEEVAEAVSL